MTKNIYTFEKLPSKSDWKCAYCLANSATHALRTRRIRDERLLSYENICDDCMIKFDNNELKKCDNCERYFREYDTVLRNGEWKLECKCEFLKNVGKDDENTDEEKEPSGSAVLEKQISELNLEKENLEIAVETSFEAIKVAETWGKSKTEQDLILEVRDLAEKRRRLSAENKELKEKISLLEQELNNFRTQLEAKIEQPPK